MLVTGITASLRGPTLSSGFLLLAVYMQKFYFLPTFSFAGLNSSHALLILLPPMQPVSVPALGFCVLLFCAWTQPGALFFICAGLAGFLQSGVSFSCALMKLTLTFSQLSWVPLPWQAASHEILPSKSLQRLKPSLCIPGLQCCWSYCFSWYLEHLDFLWPVVLTSRQQRLMRESSCDSETFPSCPRKVLSAPPSWLSAWYLPGALNDCFCSTTGLRNVPPGPLSFTLSNRASCFLVQCTEALSTYLILG